MTRSRLVHDSMGELAVPAEALYGAQTQRAVENFPISGQTMPPAFLRAMAQVKAAAARANHELGALDAARAGAIVEAAEAVIAGRHAGQFPVDVFQTGSGTSSNMNMNEVLAQLASVASGLPVHPNDHVNRAQSSNDVVPTAIQVAAAVLLEQTLLPALARLSASIGRRAGELAGVIKTGRTHLMDAMPLSFGQELSAWQAHLDGAAAALRGCQARLHALPLGGTAIGTGINAEPAFAGRAIAHLRAATGLALSPAANTFEGIAGQQAALELSGQLNLLAAALAKIANDLRWMNSGPLAGLGEIALPALQPGSSIMPGKVNPVLPEAMAMLAAHVMGAHLTISLAAQSGNFQLNVMLPLVAHHLLPPMEWLAKAMDLLATRAIAGFTVQPQRINEALQRNPVLVTALNPLIGYEKAAAIAKRAYREGRAVIDVAREDSGLDEATLRAALDPQRLAAGGLVGGDAG